MASGMPVMVAPWCHDREEARRRQQRSDGESLDRAAPDVGQQR